MSGNVVVNTAPCQSPCLGTAPCQSGYPARICIGCLGNGRRVLLDTAIPVERCDLTEADISGADVAWVEVER